VPNLCADWRCSIVSEACSYWHVLSPALDQLFFMGQLLSYCPFLDAVARWSTAGVFHLRRISAVKEDFYLHFCPVWHNAASFAV
jgi:hypothetical protein